MKKLSHVDSKGRADMVDVTGKKIQFRSARAEGFIRPIGIEVSADTAGSSRA